MTIPAGVTSIGDSAFWSCGNISFLASTEMKQKLEDRFFLIKNGVLEKYKGPGGDVVIPECVTIIGNEAFEDCSSLTSVTIPESVTSIGDSAFRKQQIKECCYTEGIGFDNACQSVFAWNT